MNSLTLDAGNSQLAFVLYQGKEAVETVRIRTHPALTAAEIRDRFDEICKKCQLSQEQVDLTISSVVPKLEGALKGAAELFSPRSFHWVCWDSPHGFTASDSARKEIGADLIAGLVGARYLSSNPLVVIDCGTATTLTVVNKENHILGVAILPGLVTQMLSLTHSAPHLPQEVSLRPPEHPYGNDTEEALQSGILYGHAAAIEGLVDRYRAYFSQDDLQAIGCGGLFHRVSPLCPSVKTEMIELVNLGCRILGAGQK